ncbi:hypothetical protein [Mesorhizobium sp.]|uniref:hypothetical protein n=1 Tax=Mesorhizobium sp. TaxID=1871066 RepID=UPI002579D8E6|nr:hypothetical protein [Mesorhizobium sp.]
MVEIIFAGRFLDLRDDVRQGGHRLLAGPTLPSQIVSSSGFSRTDRRQSIDDTIVQ